MRNSESKAWNLEREWEAEKIFRFSSTQRSSPSTQPRFSPFASLFKAKRFPPRLLENFEAIIAIAPCELVLIDVTPDDSYQDIVQAYINSSEYGKAIKCHHLGSDPGIYPYIAHCMPMWNRRLHEQLGPIREDLYGSSADWAFWLECLKINKVLSQACNKPAGLYYVNEA